MFGPGAYRPDPTEGITAIANLPPPEIVPSSRTYTRQACTDLRLRTYPVDVFLHLAVAPVAAFHRIGCGV